MEEVAKVLTFYDDESEAVMVLLSVSAEGLCKCLYENAHENLAVRVGRHRDRVKPVNEAARQMLDRWVS